MAEYLARGIQIAENRQAELLVLQLDTPGGSVELANRITQDIRASQVPVVVYVTPSGAIAGSAGTVITLAGHAAAMTPGTVIGAASPVGMEGEDLGETMEAKVKNILKATVRSLAERRGQEAIDLAERTIEDAEAVSASEALQAGLIDFVAEDLDDLLDQLDGFLVQVGSTERPVNTQGARLELFNPSLIERVLSILTNPNIVFLLLSIGSTAILIEITSPGGWFAGFVGVVCLALATYGLGVLDVNWFGIIFLLTAFALFLLDIKAPTHGALTAAAVGSLIVGALVLFNSPGVPSFQRVSVPLIVSMSLVTGALFFGVLIFAIRAQSIPVWMGQESLVGKIAVVRGEFQNSGIVQMNGEQWSAQAVDANQDFPDGTRVRVMGMEGLTLIIQGPEADHPASDQADAGDIQS
jgi:membrane-bound serine protease (ClpP class)